MRICKREVIVLRRSILAIGIVVLFIEAAFTPSINANKDFLNPDAGNICLNDSDLVCWGELNWTNVKPSETVYGRFTIRNAGKIDTLYWEISEWPEWGIWDFGSFFPKLIPGDHWIVFVNMTAPNQGNKTFTGHVKVVNKNNASDFGIINASLTTSTVIGYNVKSSILSNDGITLYVGGSGLGNYTKIQDAIDNASDGDTVFVYDDSSPYYENVVVNKSIFLIGENKNTTIIDGNSIGDVVYVSADLVAIRGFTIQNSGDYWNNYLDIYDAGLEIISNNNIICDNIIANNNVMGVILDGSSDNEYISENIITNNYFSGIILAHSSNNNRIFGNSITNNKDAGCRIILSSNNNNISKNTIKNNSIDGVVLIEADENGIYNNIISNNGNCGLEIEFYNCNNTISGNIIIDNNENGIDLHYLSNNNLILQNTIKNNRRGIDITISYDNFIYHNNFINNIVNAQDYGNNIWDDGEFGNYWSDYKQRYPKAKRIWLKGIWDAPYEITGGDNNDTCPLIKQWSKSLSRTMPSEKVMVNSLLFRFLEHFPILQMLLQRFGLQ